MDKKIGPTIRTVFQGSRCGLENFDRTSILYTTFLPRRGPLVVVARRARPRRNPG
jgi:hypothetical protein